MNATILLRLILNNLKELNYLVRVPPISMYEFANELTETYSLFEVTPSKLSSWEYYELIKGNKRMNLLSEDEIHEILKPFKKEA